MHLVGRPVRKARSRLRRAVPVPLLVVALVGGAVGVANAVVNQSTADVRGVVALVGDSNVAISGTQVALALTNRDDGYVPALITKPGAGIRYPDCLPSPCPTNDYWKYHLPQAMAKVNADIFVNNLGINDTAYAGTGASKGYSQYDDKIDWFMKLIPGSRRVLWTNLPCSIEPPMRQYGCLIVNVELGRAASRWPNLEVVNFAAAATGHPEYMADPGVSVHLSLAGQRAWAAVVAAAVDAELQAR